MISNLKDKQDFMKKSLAERKEIFKLKIQILDDFKVEICK